MNIAGTDLTLKSGDLDLSPYTKNAIFNFYEAETIHYNGASFGSTFLAPNASIIGTSGLIKGQVIARNFTGSTQFNAENYYQPGEIDGYPVPDPAHLSLAILALGAVSLRRRSC